MENMLFDVKYSCLFFSILHLLLFLPNGTAPLYPSSSVLSSPGESQPLFNVHSLLKLQAFHFSRPEPLSQFGHLIVVVFQWSRVYHRINGSQNQLLPDLQCLKPCTHHCYQPKLSPEKQLCQAHGLSKTSSSAGSAQLQAGNGALFIVSGKPLLIHLHWLWKQNKRWHSEDWAARFWCSLPWSTLEISDNFTHCESGFLGCVQQQGVSGRGMCWYYCFTDFSDSSLLQGLCLKYWNLLQFFLQNTEISTQYFESQPKSCSSQYCVSSASELQHAVFPVKSQRCLSGRITWLFTGFFHATTFSYRIPG